MDLRQLAAVGAIADHGSFSAAARALHTVQSNVSAHVARLERELGVSLVDRSTGRLTDSGDVVAARARRIGAELEALTADIASATSQVSGAVRLGMIGSTGRWLVVPLLRAMAERHPAVHVVVVDASTTSLRPQLVQGRLDLSVVNLPVRDPELEVEALFVEDRVLVVPTGHPLAAAREVQIADLGGHPLILEPVGTGFRDDLDEDAARAGVALEAMAEVDGINLIANLAFEGFGPAILPTSAVPRRNSAAWRRVTVRGLTPRSVGVATRRRALLAAPARALRDVLRDVVASEGRHHPGLRLAVPAA
ncbi:MAG: LysR family transcriptional regulator [Actinobacteria bacterium]|nr:LysR family transcriptional regulator [Actinomycetota bacterium]